MSTGIFQVRIGKTGRYRPRSTKWVKVEIQSQFQFIHLLICI